MSVYFEPVNSDDDGNNAEKAFFIRLKDQPHYSFDVRNSKYYLNNDVLVWWSHRGMQQQFVVNSDNTVSPVADRTKVLGYFFNSFHSQVERDSSLGLVLVERTDKSRKLVFKNLFRTLFPADHEALISGV